MFVLDKWYFDAVTTDGTAFIGYTASLRWLGLALGYDAFLLSAPGAPPRERSSFRRPHPPVRSPDAVDWTASTIGVRGTWRRAAPPVRRRLHRDARGSALWVCDLPRARARIAVGDDTLEGTGYVERLRLTLSPAQLPLDTLHWGRFHGPDETLVWIAWQNGAAGTWIFRNGTLQPSAAVTNDGIDGLDGGAVLEFAEHRPLRDRYVLPALAGMPGIGRRAGGLAGMHETKWLGRGSLRDPGTEADGWLIHEEVTWSARRD